MTLPRPVIAGETVMITRRCTQRQFLLRPSRRVNTVLGYCLAVAAARYGMVVHAYCFLSNHVHLVVTDPHGNRPEFCRWFFEHTAKCLNAHWGRWENLWASEQPSVVRLPDAQAQLEKSVYTVANPVAANLVTAHHHWPGIISLPARLGERHWFTRPKGFFREKGPLPLSATLTIEPLPAFAHLPRPRYRTLLSEAVAEREAALAGQRAANGKSVLGRRGVLRQSAFDRPARNEPRRQLCPRVASTDKWARVEALQRLRAFLDAYRKARQRWRVGDPAACFPPGTYAVCRYGGAGYALAP